MGFPASHWPQTAFNKIEAYGRLEFLEAQQETYRHNTMQLPYELDTHYAVAYY